MDPQIQYFWETISRNCWDSSFGKLLWLDKQEISGEDSDFYGFSKLLLVSRTKVVLMVPWHLRCLEWTKMDQDIDPSATKAFPGTTRSHVSLQNICKKVFCGTSKCWHRADSSHELHFLGQKLVNACCPRLLVRLANAARGIPAWTMIVPLRSISVASRRSRAPRWLVPMAPWQVGRWLNSMITPSIIINLHPNFIQYGSLQFGTSLLIHCSFLARFSVLFCFCDESCFQKRRSHFTQSRQKQDVPRSSLQDELSFIDLCAVSVYLRCLDDWMTWVDAKSEGWVELLPTLRF